MIEYLPENHDYQISEVVTRLPTLLLSQLSHLLVQRFACHSNRIRFCVYVKFLLPRPILHVSDQTCLALWSVTRGHSSIFRWMDVPVLAQFCHFLFTVHILMPNLVMWMLFWSRLVIIVP